MSFAIECPNCGPRPSTDFRYGGEVRPPADPDAAPEVEARRLWMRRNVAGVQQERWFHRDGCRRWLTITRDTRTNTVEPSR
jgi:heterotetrameric sarcosine oxidase delta subunit